MVHETLEIAKALFASRYSKQGKVSKTKSASTSEIKLDDTEPNLW
jgi:hypothetical protein